MRASSTLPQGTFLVNLKTWSAPLIFYQDDDPYVRKTAAICVAKLYDLSPELVEDQGFLEQIKDLLSDSNPMVVSNAVAALSEVS